MNNIISQEHEFNLMIQAIKKLPDLSMFLPWTPKQCLFLMDKRARWIYVGERIDYCQKLQLGYRPPDPTPKSIHPLLQKQVEVVGNYLFWMLQVVIEGFDDIRAFASHRKVEFPFENPRQLFAQICREFSSIEAFQITSRDIGVGETLAKIRSDQSLTGKFLRFSLPPEQESEICSSLERSGWYGLAIVAIHTRSRTYLKKSNNQRGLTWKKFREAQKAMHQFCTSKPEGDGKLCSVFWNSGHPVYSKTGKPVTLPLNLS